jgi:hypothetical protein
LSNVFGRRFQWDVRKYSVKTSTRDLVDSIVKKTSDTEMELKQRTQQYSQVWCIETNHAGAAKPHVDIKLFVSKPNPQVKNSLNAVERGQSGSLLSRNLGCVPMHE